MDEAPTVTLSDISNAIQTYEPSPLTRQLVDSADIMLLVGISGAGKDTMRQKLLNTGAYQSFVTTTTRQPRLNHGVLEQDGVEYHFISLEESLKKLQNGEYIEANVYSGNVYGTTVSEIRNILDSHKIAITDVDVNGAANYKKLSQKVIAVFILPPSFEEWQRRLASRYGDAGPDPADMKKRMQTAIHELEHALDQDYYHFIVNEDLQEAVHAADSIAHNRDIFNETDHKVHAQAQELLDDLRKHMAETAL